MSGRAFCGDFREQLLRNRMVRGEEIAATGQSLET